MSPRNLTPDDKYRVIMDYTNIPPGHEYYHDEDEAMMRYESVCSMKARGYYSATVGVRLERLSSFKLKEWKVVKKMHFLSATNTKGIK